MVRVLRSHAELIANVRSFRRALYRWYRQHARRLPWRQQPSLYGTVVSEFMLQQTQVTTALPYFVRWQRELPGFAELAAAPEARVLKLWEGLGYYSRARNLHRLSRALLARDSPPRTAEEWRQLPGIGPYTAAAIASITGRQQIACVDGNVVRILSRLTADGTAWKDTTTAARTMAPLATALVPKRAPGEHNQAMMELGATVCRRRQPLCSACPVSRFCAATHRGRPERFPCLAPRAIEARNVARVWCLHRGALLLHRAGVRSRRLAGIHELPSAEHLGLNPSAAQRGALLATRQRSITRFRITETIHTVVPPRGRLPADLVWVPVPNLDAITFSGPHRRWVREILAAREPGPALYGELPQPEAPLRGLRPRF